MGNKKKKAAKPANAEEVTEKLQTPTETKDPMKDPKVVAALKELEEHKKYIKSYDQAVEMIKHHVTQCKQRTGELLPEDALRTLPYHLFRVRQLPI